MIDQWFFEIGDGKEYGPYPLESLQKWAATGNLMPTHRVRHAESDEWVIAAYVEGLELTTEATEEKPREDEAPVKPRGVLGMLSGKKKPVEPEPQPIKASEFCDELLETAFLRGASDIHVDPEENILLVQLRIDGELEPYQKLRKEDQAAVVSRFKVMANMDIAEHRMAQDGRFMRELGTEQRRVDLRVACLPTTHGERLTLRLLTVEAGRLTLNRLGMTEQSRKLFGRIVSARQGMVLLTGPTGSGKSTTLYAALRHRLANKPGRIITVEDPVEYDLLGVSQVEVDTADKVAFGSVLRNILRSDPDVVMIGEMRDYESADVGVKAALTGHLVLSSLHTNSAVGAVTRLIDMGVDAFLVAATLRLCVAQRLIRRLCPKCRRPRELTLQEATVVGRPSMAGAVVHEAVGCDQCRGIGYKGRVGLFEVFPVEPEIQRLITSGATELELCEASKRHGAVMLHEDAADKLLTGDTSFEEVLTLGPPTGVQE